MDNPQPSPGRGRLTDCKGRGPRGLNIQSSSPGNRCCGEEGRAEMPCRRAPRGEAQSAECIMFRRRTCGRIIIATHSTGTPQGVLANLNSIKKRKFSTVDISVLITRKNAANCDKQCELQDPRVIRSLNAISAESQLLSACVLQC